MIIFKPHKKAKFRVHTLVKVKTAENILSSLDQTGKLDGCLFTEQMRRYCGQEHRVLRVVNSFFNERYKRSYRPRSPLYLLENLLCDGVQTGFSAKCDHGCFLFWREEWLEAVR
jgi:hypothetical protein